jgi:predicted transcriptional regulator
VSSLEESAATTTLTSQKTAATTTTTTTTNETVARRRILHATIESSDVDHFGGTTKSRIVVYSRFDYKTLKPHLDTLVEQGLITRQDITHDNPNHSRRTWDKNRAKSIQTIYRVTPLGYDWLLLLQEQDYKNKQQPDSQ